MPTETFQNLSPEKRHRFIEAALKEFGEHNFETASINRIIKNLRIARGSVYQYFEDKLDLWLYLKEYAEDRKMAYIRKVDRQDHPDFWDYYRQLYYEGVYFDMEEPLSSRFLYRIQYKESSAEVASLVDSWKIKALELFTHWLDAEKAAGAIEPCIPSKTAAHVMIAMSQAITEMFQSKYQVRFAEQFEQGQPLLAGHINEFREMVDEIVHILKKALQ